MDSERTRRVEELFDAIIELPPPMWAEELSQRAGDDELILKEVRALLDCHARAEGFLDAAKLLGDTLAASAEEYLREEALPEGTRIGEYRLGRLLGTGGMGSVYIAAQERPRRVVALKLIRRGFSTAMVLRRFEHEAEVLGRLQHPGIAQIYAAGTAPMEGKPPQPYIAMELVEGMSLTAYAESLSLRVGERMELVARIADAVHHAHQRGVIHRDLKPANIIVDQSGQPKILDFGVARAMGSEHALTTMQTGIGQLLGTLPYMSPEQVAGDPGEIDTRSDVYALGVLLYELLTGRLPYDVRRRSLPEAARIIREDTPDRLSSISRVFRGDTDTIVSKALEKEKSRRYQSAAELRDDIRLYLEGKPIQAKQDSALYVLGKQIQRFRWLAAAIVAFILGSSLFAVYAVREANAQKLLADRERAARADAEASGRRAEAQQAMTQRSLYVSNIGFAQAAHASRDVARVLRLLDDCPIEMRGWEWRYLRRIADTALGVTPMPDGGVPSISMGTHGRLCGMVGTSGDYVAQIFDTQSSTVIVQKSLPELAANCVISADARKLLAVLASSTVWSWDVDAGTSGPVALRAMTGQIVMAASADLSVIVLGRSNCEGCTTQVCEPRTGKVIRDLGKGGICAALTPDGEKVIIGYEDGRIRIASTGRGASIGAPDFDVTVHAHRSSVWAITLSPDMQRIASVGFDGAMVITDLSGRMLLSLPVCDNKLFDVAWSPDGLMLATAGTDCVIRIIDPALPKVVLSLTGHRRRVDCLFWSDAGLASTARDGFRRWWGDPRRDQIQPSASLPPSVNAVVNRDTNTMFIARNDGDVLCLNLANLRVESEIPDKDDALHALRLSPDRTRLLRIYISGKVNVVDLATRKTVVTIHTSKGRATSAAFNPAGDRIAVSSDTEPVTIWNASSGDHLLTMPAPAPDSPGWSGTLAWSPDGKHLAVGYGKEVIGIQDATNGRYEMQLRLPKSSWASSLLYSRDGQRLFSAHDDGDIFVIDVPGGKVIHHLRGHQNATNCIDLSPDETRLISGGWDNTVRMWDVQSGLELLTLRKHTSGVQFVGFDPTGEQITSLSLNGELFVWSAADPVRKP